MDDNTQYLDIFFEETDETLIQLNDLVLHFEENPEDMVVLNEIFRAAHTLKGMAGTMGFESMTEVTHNLENVFTELKDETISADNEVINFVFKSLDALSEIVEELRLNNEESSEDYSKLIEMSQQIVKRANNEDFSVAKDTENDMVFDESDWSVIETALVNHYQVYRITVHINPESLMVNARAFLVINKLEEEGELLKAHPTVDILETEEFGHSFSVVYVTELAEEIVYNQISQLSEVASVEISPVETRQTETKESVEPQAEHKKEVEDKEKKEKSKKKRSINTQSQSIRVDLDKLDSFMNLVSELVIYRTQLEEIGRQTGNKNLEETLSYVSRITNELQALVLNIRMQPLHTVTSRFSRVVRDLSNESKKPMRLVIEGEDTELDRTIVSELSEPLIHLIRNSADHGIEAPEVRKTRGKDETGTIKISKL